MKFPFGWVVSNTCLRAYWCNLSLQRSPSSGAAACVSKPGFVKLPVSQETLQLADWTLLLTNVPEPLLSVAEAMVLIRARWQVEIAFQVMEEPCQDR